MAERWVSKVVGEAPSFDCIGIKHSRVRFVRLTDKKLLSKTSTDLGYLQCVGQPIVKCVSSISRNDLSDS
jgi:hypothetical protein